MTSTATRPGSRAGEIVRVLRGKGLGRGEPLPMREIMGKRATLELSINPESGWNRVEAITSVPKQLPLEDTSLLAAAEREPELGLDSLAS